MTTALPINTRPKIRLVRQARPKILMAPVPGRSTRLAVLPGAVAAQRSADIAEGAAATARQDAGAVAASLSAEFLVRAVPPPIPNARAVGDTPTVMFDWDATGSVTANVPDSAIIYAKIQNVGGDRLLGSIAGGVVEEIALTAAGRALIDDVDAEAQRATLGLVIGTDVQTQDAELQALASLTSASDKLPYFTGPGVAAMADLTPFARTLLDDMNSGATLTTLGVSSFAQTLLDDNNAATARSTLGLVPGTDVQVQDAELSALAGLASSADRLPYFTGAGTAALATFTAFGRSLIDDADATTARTTLGLAIGTHVQAQSANLAAEAGLAGIADRVSYYTGAGAKALAMLTSFGRSLIGLADYAALRAGLGYVTASIDNTVPRFDGVAGSMQPSNVTISDNDDLSGVRNLTVAGAQIFSGDISSGALSANQHDYAPSGLSTASRLRLDATTALGLTGIAAQPEGFRLLIHNTSAFAITLYDQHAGSMAANRLALNGDVVLAQNQSIEVEYDGATSRWRAIGGIGGGSGVTDGDKGDVVVSGGGTSWMLDGAAKPMGYGQVWQNVIASRSLGVAYQNTTGRTILIAVSITITTDSFFQLSSDGSTWLNVVELDNGLGRFTTVLIIPSGWFYRTPTASGLALVGWHELR